MVKNLPANARDTGLILGSGRSPGEGNSNPLQYSCLGNLMDRGAWWATIHGVARVKHSLATKLPPPPRIKDIHIKTISKRNTVIWAHGRLIKCVLILLATQ